MAAAYDFNNQSRNQSGIIDEEDRICRSCQSQNLLVDWAQGDRVCTDCGVVDESHIRDDRPEWKDFGEAEDLVKGLPSGARSGLVVVDETKYLGGLQPTTLSKQAFGGHCPLQGQRTTDIRKSLLITNRKMDNVMEKEQKRALKRAKLSLLLKRKDIDVGQECDVQPEHDAFILHEEEESQRAHAALYHQKWSLDRALLLYSQDGGIDEATSSPSSLPQEEARADLVARLDKPLKRASHDLYTAYIILQHAARRLDLPQRVLQQSAHTLCRYAAQKDGLTVRGIASRISEKLSSTANDLSETAAEQLTTYNRQKQMAALASALLFVEARKQGYTRPLQEVCASFQYPIPTDHATSNCVKSTKTNFIKGTHCSKAMKELRLLFPDYMRAAAVLSLEPSSQRSDNFVERATRKLELPPVATASIQVLVEELQGKASESTKISTTCAAVTLLVCMSGSIMQRLARQAMEASISTAKKRRKTGDVSHIKLETKTGVDMANIVKPEPSRTKEAKFDVFTHPAAIIDGPSYEMRQMWDAWAEQMPWGRSVAALEQAFSISKPAVLEFFKTKIYPKRVQLLSLLQESSKLRATPRAAVLLSQMSSTASPLLNSQGKVL